MEKIIYSWVHLSDIHFNHGSVHNQLDQILVLEKLRQDIINANNRGISKINAIYITGDIATTGDNNCDDLNDISSEYNKAKSWLTDLCSSIGINARNVYLVPGNHDIQLSSSDDNRNLDRLLEKLRDHKESIDDVLNHPTDKTLVLQRLKNYLSFASNFSPYCLSESSESYDIYWQHQLKLEDDILVRVIGTNTALLTIGKDDAKKLQLGNYPLVGFIATDPIKTNEIVIVLSHHPFDWLYDEENVSAWIKSNCHVHLCGHIHNSKTEKYRSGTGNEYIKIVSGAAHANDGSIIGHGYSICQFVLSDQILKLRVWPRKWSDNNKAFRSDVDNVPDGREFTDHDINALITHKISSDSLPAMKNENGIRVPIQSESVKSVKPISISIYKSNSATSESLPTSPVWVGREAELDLFNDNSIKVFAVTGIGGQGKSALVARYIENLIKDGTTILWHWKDCREEGDTLQTHVLSIIEKITDGKLDATSFIDEDITVIIDHFF